MARNLIALWQESYMDKIMVMEAIMFLFQDIFYFAAIWAKDIDMGIFYFI